MVKIAYQGISGSYSQQAIVEFARKHGLELEAYSTHDFKDLFEAIDNVTFLGLVPIENSTAGSVVQSYDLFLDYDFEIIAETYLEVQHCLLANKGVALQDVRKVISHPQALSQCSEFISSHKWEAISVFDTAGSAKQVAEKGLMDTAAIASALAAEKYGLKILSDSFQNNMDNVTRFLFVKKRGKTFDFESALGNSDKSTVMFETKNIPAALYKCLGGFATNAVNLVKIESRPKKNGERFKPVFYVDFEGSLSEKNVLRALEELEHFSVQVVELGSYPKG